MGLGKGTAVQDKGTQAEAFLAEGEKAALLSDVQQHDVSRLDPVDLIADLPDRFSLQSKAHLEICIKNMLRCRVGARLFLHCLHGKIVLIHKDHTLHPGPIIAHIHRFCKKSE